MAHQGIAISFFIRKQSLDACCFHSGLFFCKYLLFSKRHGIFILLLILYHKQLVLVAALISIGAYFFAPTTVLSLPARSFYVCFVDFKVASSIYRKPWLIEQSAAIEYINMLEQIRQGKASFMKRPSAKLAQYAAHASIISAPDNRYSAKEHPGYEGRTVAVLPVSGPLMKSDFCGWFGTASLRNELNKITATDSVKTIVLHIDSPGGSVDGTTAFGEAIRSARSAGKEVIAIIDGLCASAAYWIASQCDRIVATAGTDIIGSIGTMFSIQDGSAYMQEMGIVVHEYYADASKDKNKMFKEASEGKGKLLIQDLLNPMNDLFLTAVRTGRGEKLNEKETLSGKTFLSAQALEYGLIDEISSMDATLNTLISKHTNKTAQITMKFTFLASVLAAFGFAGVNSAADIKEEHLEKVDGALEGAEKTKAELATSKQRVLELEAAATTSAEKITHLEADLKTANANLTTANASLTKANAEVDRLGKLDAGAFTDTSAEGDSFEDTKVDAADMAFQKELMNKI